VAGHRWPIRLPTCAPAAHHRPKTPNPECKLFKRLGLRSTFYTDDAMLQRFPLKPPLPEDTPCPPQPQSGDCALCGRKGGAGGEVSIKKTRCCEQVGLLPSYLGSGWRRRRLPQASPTCFAHHSNPLPLLFPRLTPTSPSTRTLFHHLKTLAR
jgi:hypothetical protein